MDINVIQAATSFRAEVSYNGSYRVIYPGCYIAGLQSTEPGAPIFRLSDTNAQGQGVETESTLKTREPWVAAWQPCGILLSSPATHLRR
jgi:hypothetical protein